MRRGMGTLALLAGTALAQTPGTLDVWALRSAVAEVEALTPQGDADACRPEGDGETTPTAAQQRMAERAAQACEAAHRQALAAFDAARARFNTTWRPLLQLAIARGDRVAEVIWRQCSTTHVLDRAGLESTCPDEPAPRRAVAARRLQEIGFEPAFDWASQPPIPRGPDERRLVQAQVLRRFATGDLGAYSIGAYHGGNAPMTAAELDEIRNGLVIGAVLREARRGFTYSDRLDNDGSLSTRLPLNRPVATPGLFTWGAAVPGSSSHGSLHDWRGGPLLVYLKYEQGRELRVGDTTDAIFLARLRDTLAAAEARIDHWLRQDARWGVFLLHRVGWHEWVPERVASRQGRLDASWAGEWALTQGFVDLRPDGAEALHARIVLAEDGALLQFDRDPASGQAQVACRLRYSGGNSALPEGRSHATSAASTVLGYLPGLTTAIAPGAPGPVPPFEPMDPTKRYRQVLVQCPQGEWPDARRARHLFLAGDTLVELSRELRSGAPLWIRHWKRSTAAARAWPAMPAVPPEPGMAELLAQIDRAARRAQGLEQRLRSATPADLVAMLDSWRVDSPWYGSWDFPEPLHRLTRLPAAVPLLCQRLAEKPADALLRFNLVLAIHQLAYGERIPVAERPAAATCLRQALGDAHPWVRAEAVWGLAKLGRGEDAGMVHARQADADAHVVQAARAALVYLKQREAERVKR